MTFSKCRCIEEISFQKLYKFGVYLTLYLLLAANAKGQDSLSNQEVPVFKSKKNIRQAKKSLRLGDPFEATRLYEEVLVHEPENFEIAWELATIYFEVRDYENAARSYYKLYREAKKEYPAAQYWYALMLKMNGKYEEAQKQFNDFTQSARGEGIARLRKWAVTESKGCSLALTLKDLPPKAEVVHLDSMINSAYSDISPMLWNDSTLLFASLPSDTLIYLNFDEFDTNNVDYHTKFYTSEMLGATFAEPEQLPYFNTPGQHTCNGAFSTDGKRFYFTRCLGAGGIQTKCDIFVSKKENGRWQWPEMLDYEINDGRYTNTQPTVGPYKSGKEILYFVSNRENGKGGFDLWYSIYDIKNDAYGKPFNCGSSINTDRDEFTPHIDKTTGTLYFSSNGHVNIGGLDIFSAIGQRNKWSAVQNMGIPLNSPADDMYFKFDRNQRTGYFVSNRPGIISIKHETCCDDIFSFKYNRTLDLAVEGIVYDEALPDYPLNGVKVSLTLKADSLIGESILINQVETAGNKAYLFDLDPEKEYSLTAYKPTYLIQVMDINTLGKTKTDTIALDIYLKRLIVNDIYAISNVQYEYNSAELTANSKVQLDSVYKILSENPQITIELRSHTDSRGSEDFNQNLSERRAQACVDYLVQKGIDTGRLVAKGLGESEPLEDCSGIAACPGDDDTKGDCPCHEKNRRTEYKIIEEKDIELFEEEQ